MSKEQAPNRLFLKKSTEPRVRQSGIVLLIFILSFSILCAIIPKYGSQPIFISLILGNLFLIVLQILIFFNHLQKKKYERNYHALLELEAEFPPKNLEEVLQIKTKLDQLASLVASDRMYKIRSYFQRYKFLVWDVQRTLSLYFADNFEHVIEASSGDIFAKLNHMKMLAIIFADEPLVESKIQAFIDHHVSLFIQNTTQENVAPLQKMQKILYPRNQLECERVFNYLAHEAKLLQILQEFASRYNHIHLSEIQERVSINEVELEHFILMLLDRGKIDGHYDRNHRNLIFDWHVTEEIEELTASFENWEKTDPLKKK